MTGFAEKHYWRIPVSVFLMLTALSSIASADEELLFERQIRPLLKARCFSCHGEGEELAGQLDVRLVKSLLTGGDSGPSVVPKQRDDSPLYQRIRDGEMPPDGLAGFTPQQVELIGRWIDAGAATKRHESATAANDWLTPEDREFWSFQPLERPQIPGTNNRGWLRNPVDAFALSVLEQRHLQPAVSADPRTLLRRLSYVTTGLPPSAEDVEQFAGDQRPERVDIAIERLLASPQFGERWARAWLDLVRYVDHVPGYAGSAQNAWLYRDWVIEAFNSDRPYDEFVRLQLAADLLPDVSPADKAALGFLGLSPVYWKELQLAPGVIEGIVADEWDERIDVVTRTYLGLTVSCARCHNHKFDPISVQDYYALAGVISSTRMVDQPLLPAAEAAVVARAREQVSQWEATITSLKSQPSALVPVLQARITRLQAVTPHYHEPWAHGVEDASVFVLPDGKHRTKLEYRKGQARNLPVFRRGNPADQGELVERRFLEVLSPDGPKPFEQGSGRAELSQAILEDGQALAARVIVNRIWAQVFGRGLVATPSDFGRQGDPPTHPELLDYLACRLVEEGWAIKPVLREILQSATFRQSCFTDEVALQQDPDGRYLSHFQRRRLPVEMWRDTLLLATSQLKAELYGPAEPLTDTRFTRRTIYGQINREEVDTMLRLFDFPEASGHSPSREPTTTPLQQLFVLNGSLLQTMSRQFANTLQPLATDAARIDAAYQRLLQRAPTDRERAQGVRFLSELSAEPGNAREAWSAYAQVLLSLNEVMFLE